MVVVDASVVVDVLAFPDQSQELRATLLRHGDLAAPHLIDVEVLSALRRLVRLGQIGVDRADDAKYDLAELPMERCSHELLIDRIWELRDALNTYDATYLALAEAMAIPLITRDAGLASVAERMVKVEFFPPSG